MESLEDQLEEQQTLDLVAEEQAAVMVDRVVLAEDQELS
jgi:hypothetical protein